MVQLLNVCCAPCGLPIIEYLIKSTVNGNNLSLYFYGPNIYPEDEYIRRLGETQKIAALYGLQLFEGDYDHENWLAYVKGKLVNPPEDYPENGERCSACFQYRLQKTALFAKENGFNRFATTLSVSRFKDTAFINGYGEKLAAENQLTYVTFPLDAGEAHRLGLELSKRHDIYRQKYCGCEFSVR